MGQHKEKGNDFTRKNRVSPSVLIPYVQNVNYNMIIWALLFMWKQNVDSTMKNKVC